MKNFYFFIIFVLCFSFVSGGCATKNFVAEQISTAKKDLSNEIDRTESSLNANISGVESRLQPQIDSLSSAVSANESAVGQVNSRIDGLGNSISEVKKEVGAVEKKLDSKISDQEKTIKKVINGSAGVLQKKINALRTEVDGIFSCDEKADRKKVRCEAKCGDSTDPTYAGCMSVCAAKYTLDADACACAARAAVPGV